MSYIYVTQNDGLPGIVQIGMTDDNPEVRAQELSNITGALGRFAVARQWQLKDAAIYERRISAVLGCYHLSGEHFRLPVEGAIRRITALLYSWGVVNEEGLTRDEAQAVREAAALRSRLPTLWSRSYYAGSVGAVSDAVVRRYIENKLPAELA
jgi:hypothetical protein